MSMFQILKRWRDMIFHHGATNRLTLVLTAAGWLAAALLLGFVQVRWLATDQRPFAWDESIHYMGAWGYYKLLALPLWEALPRILQQSDFYPPMHELFVGVWMRLIGPGPDQAALFNLFYLYGIGILLWRNARQHLSGDWGLLSVVICVCSAFVVIQSKWMMLDIPLTFWVLAFYTLYQQHRLGLDWKHGIGLGAVLAAGMLVKWSALFFTLFPLGVIGALELVTDPKTRAARLRFFAALAITLTILAAPWYATHLVKLVMNTRGYIYARGVVENDPPLASWQAWAFYPEALMHQTSAWLGIFIFAGLAIAIARKRLLREEWLWVVAPLLVLILIRNKDQRYTLPLLPLLILWSNRGWFSVLNLAWRQRVAVFVGLLALAQFAWIHWGEGPAKTYRWGSLHLIDTMPPDSRPWPLGEIISRVSEVTPWPNPVLRIVPDDSHFSLPAFHVAKTFVPKADVQISSLYNWPQFTDFAVTKTGSLGLDFTIRKAREISAELEAGQAHPEYPFRLVETFPLPEQNTALLYKRHAQVFEPGMNRELAADLVTRQVRSLCHDYVREAPDIKVTCQWSSQPGVLVFDRIRVVIPSGQVGDFKHKPIAAPFQALDIELRDVELDLRALRAGRLVVYQLRRLQLNHLELEEKQVNAFLPKSHPSVAPLHLDFQDGRITVQWHSRPALQASISLRVGPQPQKNQSQNLFFRLEKISVGGFPLNAWLTQSMLEDFNPILNLQGFPAEVVLGHLSINATRMVFENPLSSSPTKK